MVYNVINMIKTNKKKLVDEYIESVDRSILQELLLSIRDQDSALEKKLYFDSICRKGDLDEYFGTLKDVVECISPMDETIGTGLKGILISLLKDELKKFEENNGYPLHEVYDDFDTMIEEVFDGYISSEDLS